MQRVNLNGVDLEYAVRGSGEPLLLIHGSILADALFHLLAEPGFVDNYRGISYHRRGFAGRPVPETHSRLGSRLLIAAPDAWF